MATMLGEMPDEISKLIHDFIRPKKKIRMSAELLEDIKEFWTNRFTKAEWEWGHYLPSKTTKMYDLYSQIEGYYEIDYGVYTNYDYDGESSWENDCENVEDLPKYIFEEPSMWDDEDNYQMKSQPLNLRFYDPLRKYDPPLNRIRYIMRKSIWTRF